MEISTTEKVMVNGIFLGKVERVTMHDKWVKERLSEQVTFE